MAEVTLLPRKAFEIRLEDGTLINGKFSLWSIKRYCDLKKLSLSGLEQQLSADTISFDDICKLILCAVEHVYREKGEGMPYNDLNVCDWIEEMGGITGEKYTSLMAHAQSDLEQKESDEKKSQ